jgi:hypothetical protein
MNLSGPTPLPHLRSLALAGALLLALAVSPLAARAQVPPAARLPGHVLRVLPSATKLPRDPSAGDRPLTLSVLLDWSDPAGFAAYTKSVEDPKSPNYRRTTSPAELASRFGPSQQAYDAVLAYLQQRGFALVDGSTNRLTLTVRGTRAQAERAFSVSLDDYRLGGRTFRASDTDPALPAELAPLVRGVSGLSDLARPRPAGLPAAAPNPATPMAVAAAYNAGGLPPGTTGAGQVIALVELDYFNPSDVANWLARWGLPASTINQLSTVNVNGGTPPSNGGGTAEVLGDVDTVMGIAPAASYIVVDAPQGTPDIDVVNSAINAVRARTGGFGGSISMSWNECEAELSASDLDGMETLLQAASAYGLSFFASSGDTGSTCVDPQGTWANNALFPADAPHAVAVGGTNLQVGAANAYQGESWWSSGAGAGGYGVSGHFARPWWQGGYTGAAGRSVPDVAADADPSTAISICQGASCNIGFNGTSLAAPIWAATWALVCQGAGSCGSASGGYLYSLETPPPTSSPGAFHPASLMTGAGNDFAHVGLGSPDIAYLASLYAGAPQVQGLSQTSVPFSGGTPVSITGRNFIDVQSVQFSSTLGGYGNLAFTVNSPALITLAGPSWSHGDSGDLVVTTPAGLSVAKFSFSPVVTAISPSSGPMQGGTGVTISGAGFDTRTYSANQVYFGGVASPNQRCDTSTSCTAVSPAANPGTVDLTVATDGGLSQTNANDKFTYTGPLITSISPSVGPYTGGTWVQLNGTGLAAGMSVRFGSTMSSYGASCPGGNSTWCTTESPAVSPASLGPCQCVDIIVTVDGVSSNPTAGDKFYYRPFPTVSGVAPASGPASGGTKVTISGTNFSTTPGATGVKFGPNAATGVSCSAATQCVATSPTGTGTVDVTVTVGGLTSSATAADRFSYAPVITGVSPASGPQTGGTRVTISGFGFTGDSVVSFSFGPNLAFGAVSCSGATSCTMTSPAGSGTVDVRATLGAVTSATSAADRFTYQPASLAGWVRWYLPSGPSLQPGLSGALTYDAARGVVLDAGTALVSPDGPQTGSATWTWSGGGNNWAPQSPATSPPARRGASLTFDRATGTAVLFGGVEFIVSSTGRGSFRLAGDTWTWDGSAWTQQHPATSPPARAGASIAYDAAHQRAVLFGGGNGLGASSAFTDTWTWDGSAWTQQHPVTSPPARADASIAYDVTHGTVVLFGGLDSGGNLLSDTWVWDGSTWAQQHPATSPGARQSAGLAYHPASGGLLLFGGWNSSSGFSDTWGWNGSTWTQLSAGGSSLPLPASGTSNMDYDAATNLVVLLGADGSTWTWGG